MSGKDLEACYYILHQTQIQPPEAQAILQHRMDDVEVSPKAREDAVLPNPAVE